AIFEIGPGSKIFLPDLMRMLEEPQEPNSSSAAKALAAVIDDNAEAIRAIVQRLDDPRPGVVSGATSTLWYIADRAAKAAPKVVEKMIELTEVQSPIRYSATLALGCVARCDVHAADIVVQRLLDVA